MSDLYVRWWWWWFYLVPPSCAKGLHWVVWEIKKEVVRILAQGEEIHESEVQKEWEQQSKTG